MKTQTTNESTNIIIQVPNKNAPEVEKALRGFLKLAGHKVRRINEEGEELYTPEEIFPDSTPATRLRGLRTREDMTQKKFAEALSLKQHHISEMENGKRPISVAMAKRLETVFGIAYKVFL